MRRSRSVGRIIAVLALSACAGGSGAAPAASAARSLAARGIGKGTIDVDGWAALERRPIAALIERDAWIDFREPRFVLYADGSMIFGTASGAREGRLDADETARFVATVAGSGFLDLPVHIDFTGAKSDQPTVQMFFRHDGRWTFGNYPGVIDSSHTSGGAAPPGAIAIPLEAMREPHPASSHPWVPARLRLILTNCDQPRDGAKPWPTDVPAPNAADVRARAPGVARMRKLGAYEHLVPGSHEARMRAFLASLGPPGTVEIGDGSCSIDLLREYPGERYLEEVSDCAWARLVPTAGGPRAIAEGCRE